MPEPFAETCAVSNGTKPSRSQNNGKMDALNDFVHPMGIEAVRMPTHVIPASLPGPSSNANEIPHYTVQLAPASSTGVLVSRFEQLHVCCSIGKLQRT